MDLMVGMISSIPDAQCESEYFLKKKPTMDGLQMSVN